MTNLKGMDELLSKKEFKDVQDWTKRLKMASKVRGYDETKKFKIVRLNLWGNAKDLYKKLEPPLADWNEMKAGMQQKFGDVDLDELRMKRNIGKRFNFILIGLTSYSKRER
jgi:hypothetical protein